ALSNKMRKANEIDGALDATLIEDRTPLIAQGFQLIPAGSMQFKKTDQAGFYVEVYEPLLSNPDAKDVAVALQMRVFDRNTKEQKFDSGPFRIPLPDKAGNPAI